MMSVTNSGFGRSGGTRQKSKQEVGFARSYSSVGPEDLQLYFLNGGRGKP